MREGRMDTFVNAITITSVEEIYAQLIEHLSDRFSDPTEATNRATRFLAKYYLNAEE